MNTFATIHDFCMNLPGTVEDFPFGENVLVYKVGGKMYGLLLPDQIPIRMNLKCDPERSIDLREEYESILPGYHMNKKHWNTVITEGDVPEKLLFELIGHSYQLVLASLPKRIREELQAD